ncbi:MAG: hypothetical protein WC371_05445 [Parachlamydiales bacterium]
MLGFLKRKLALAFLAVLFSGSVLFSQVSPPFLAGLARKVMLFADFEKIVQMEEASFAEYIRACFEPNSRIVFIFLYQEPLDLSGAETLLRQSQQMLLDKINGSPLLSGYFTSFPFSFRNVSLTLMASFFQKDEMEKPQLYVVSLVNNTLKYHSSGLEGQ